MRQFKGDMTMNKNDLIEIFPSVVTNQTDCCDSDNNSEEGCCEESNQFLKESLELKEQLKEHFDKLVNVHLYNYELSMDRVLAQKKLSQLIQERGFGNISEDSVLRYVTPAVVVNGTLVSFATKPQMESVLKVLNK
jgi:hypothetical protein